MINGIRFAVRFSSQFTKGVGKKFTSELEVDKFLHSPSWSIKQLIASQEKTGEISNETIRKMLKLSGLREDITKDEENEMVKSLRTQMAFIQALYDKDDTGTKESSNDAHFRLIKEDKTGSTITLKALKQRISQLDNEVDLDKGERGNNSLQLNMKSGYFTIKK